MTCNECPLGIQFWAEHYKYGTPAFRVFRCLGTAGDVFIFESINKPVTLITKTWLELGGKDFRPFLIPVEKIRKRYGEEY